jgi:hypothetical protein
MTIILAGETVQTHGTLSAPQYLDVAAGGAVLAQNGAANNARANLYGSTQVGVAGAAGSVLAQGTAINGVNGQILLYGGGNLTNGAGYGATFNVAGTLANAGEIFLVQSGRSGAAALLDVAAGGSLENGGNVLVSGAGGSAALPGLNVPGTAITVEGVATNAGFIGVGGGILGAGYGGGGGRLVLDGAAGTGLVNSNGGTILISGAYGSGMLGAHAPQDGGMVQVQSGTLVNQGQITVAAGVNDRYGYAGAGGVLETLMTGELLNTGTITVNGETTGYFGPTPAGLLANNGVYFRSSGEIDVLGGSVHAGTGGTFTTASNFDLSGGRLYVHDGVLGDGAGVADLGGEVQIGVSASATLLVGGSVYGTMYQAGSAVISGHTVLGAFGTIATIGPPTFYDGGPAGGVTVSPTGLLTIHGGYVTGYGTLTNHGHIVSIGISTIENIGMVTNDGAVTVEGGRLMVETDPFIGYVAGSGRFSIMAGGTLGFYTGVAASQTVSFAASPGETETLALNDPAQFLAALSGLNDSSVLDIQNQQVTGVTTNGDVLFIREAGVTYHFKLSSPLPLGTTFTRLSDGHGGTDIGFDLAGGPPPGDRWGEKAGGSGLAAAVAGHLSS